MEQLITPRMRSWLYGIVTAALALAVGYGIIDPGNAEHWLALASAVLGLAGSATAFAYRPTRVPRDAPDMPTDEPTVVDIA